MSNLRLLPSLDSEQLAFARRAELQLPRALAASLGLSAVEAARMGHYQTRDGQRIDWKQQVEAARAAKLSIRPNDELPRHASTAHAVTRVQVANETTLGAARRLVDSGHRPLALNFANGGEPGGGFLRGALAQEETLCRSSALYLTLEGDPMYDAHGKRPKPDATDWAIYSPRVPVFRTDAGEELAHPWLLDFLTCAAPYAPHVGQPESGNLLQRRIHRVFEIARAYGHSTLVLGAWGCGAFRNDPRRTALDFQGALEGEYQGAFSEIVFAITDWSTDRRTLGAFRDVFSPSTQPS
jgi:uncharacterized protein (TIGR02452 family)